MFEYVEELNYKITEKNYIKELQEMFSYAQPVTSLDRGGLYSISCCIEKNIRNNDVHIHVSVEFDEEILYRIKLQLDHEEDDETNYDMDLRLFYFEEIKSPLFDAINKPQVKYTLRVYKMIYNSTPIYGFYETNGSNKIAFHTLSVIPKKEPWTEHIICFDIELEERNFERAKSKANNIIADFCGYLSVLLDIGFHEPSSKFINFIRTDYVKAEKVWKHERYKTAFFDAEIGIYVKDNMNGICTINDLKQGVFNNGYYAISSLDGENTLQMRTGELSALERIFDSHRLYKIRESIKNSKDYKEERIDKISTKIHFMNEPINIPNVLRRYVRGIEEYKKENFDNYLLFRNACRLYNKSKVLSVEGASLEISFLVACLECLSKTEQNQSFSTFVMKYNEDACRKDMDSLYGIRSKLFHAGNFSFFEYEYDVNPYSNPLYIEFRDKYLLFKQNLRKAFINWIYENLIKDCDSNIK